MNKRQKKKYWKKHVLPKYVVRGLANFKSEWYIDQLFTGVDWADGPDSSCFKFVRMGSPMSVEVPLTCRAKTGSRRMR